MNENRSIKRVAVVQSNYVPWKGYFDIIHDVDLFVFYDDVLYTKNDWRNRNKIVGPNGLIWLTIPVGARGNRLIYEVELTDSFWCRKHWKTIVHSYSKAPYFALYRDFFEQVFLDIEWNNLSELNQYLVRTISSEFLGLETEFRDSREFQPVGKELDRLLDLLSKVEAGLYVSGPTARAYIDENRFTEAGIKLVYKDYAGYPEYPQRNAQFEHAVSILDVLFNCGPEAPDFIWGWRDGVTGSSEAITLPVGIHDTE